ncbi:MAG: agmatine deiminase family protein [Clostridia bacterium]|nr:agmatine deiminase family protein [Clostridia bacterium]
MPAEYGRHEATVMIWPERPGSWPHGGKYARPAFTRVVRLIAEGEKVYLSVSPGQYPEAMTYLFDLIEEGKVIPVNIPTNDSWARDISPVFVRGGGKVMGVDFAFNAWGGDYDGLYRDYRADDAFAGRLCALLSCETMSARPFVLEGGSVHSDGKGTLLVTEECLLSPGRNPGMNKGEIEETLRRYLGARRVVWLPYGVLGDETDGHVDNICAFTGDGRVVLSWTEEGEQGERCRKDLDVLKAAGLDVAKVPFPKEPVRITKRDLDGFSFEEGEDEREEGEVLAASYVNFYVCNSAVIVPRFGDENDDVAADIIGGCFPGKKIAGVLARDLLVGGGGIHCLTMQIPAGEV